MSIFKIVLPDSENPNKAAACGEWEDTPAKSNHYQGSN